MPKALDQDLRDRVIDAVLKDGMSRRCASERFGVSASTAVKWVQAVEREARRHPVGTGGHRPSALPAVREWLLSQIEERPDQTLATLCRRLRDEQGVKAVPSMLSMFFRKQGISFKKKPYLPASKTGLTWPVDGNSGGNIRIVLILSGWFSSTKPGPKPI